jgi:3-deoxy-D-manno-octulosonic acid kinase
MNIRTAPLASGELIYDGSRWSPAQAVHAFDAVAAASEPRGRGKVRYLALPFAEAVLRRYRRGGFAARFSEDWYLWRGRDATRPFREFRLTAALHADGLPVPRPLAARYLRAGLGYRADLITERIPDAETLAEHVQAGRAIDWAAIGRLLARFHRRGLWHADLNAHNVMIDATCGLWLIDLDRGRLRAPDRAWMRGNLLRLKRSLLKVGAAERVQDFEASVWPRLLAAHAAG